MLFCAFVASWTAAYVIPEREASGLPHLRSESVAVRFVDTGEVVIEKNPRVVRPIASVTKLLSGVVIDAIDKDPTTVVTITEDDKDRLKWSKSRLKVGLVSTWLSLFQAALGASDNRAMYASVRALGLERPRFVVQMNEMAKTLGMKQSSFKDPAGIDPGNVSTANDLLVLLDSAASKESIRQATQKDFINVGMQDEVMLTNPNRLARSGRWEVVIGKTGYTVEAGRSLVLRATLGGRTIDMVLIGAREMASVFGDAGRVRRYLEEKYHLGKTAKATGPSLAQTNSLR
ncbi:MAG: D-alanyl-D-alanine carboxypeptidase [Deltaproteobacteria bacterium]|nr:D-alanyl-D-alanine carboxypeptidase [Deltaproteobacteria bacterium]